MSSTRGKYVYEGKEERFTTITALVFFQCVVNYLYAFIMAKVFPTQEKDTTKSWYYGLCSLTYLVAMVTSNKALSWVNYPTQVIGEVEVTSLHIIAIFQENPVNPFLS